MNYRALKEEVFSLLRNRLPDNLSYHDMRHTQDVLNSVERLGKAEGVSFNELGLLKTAALLHDIGFTVHYENHEERSCQVAREMLPAYNYTEEEIELICGMIMATKVPQRPQTHLEQILCDADLDYLGRDDYWKISGKLYEEFLTYGIIGGRDEWYKLQVEFFNTHQFFTKSAKKAREKKKQQHFNKIITALPG